MGVIVWVFGGAALLAQTQAAPPTSGLGTTEPSSADSLEETDSAEVAILDGNVVGAKKRALEEAFLHAVERGFSAELIEAGVGTAALGDDLQKFKATFPTAARRYVRSYRVVQESESNGKLLIRVVATVDRVVLRRQIEKSKERLAVASADAAKPIQVAVAEGSPEFAMTLSGALRSSGLLVQVLVPPLAAANGATRVTLKTVIRHDGNPRGTGLQATRCQLDATVQSQDGGRIVAVPSSLEWGFGSNVSLADKACLDRLASLAARNVAQSLSAAIAPSARKFLNVVLDIVEPVALERFLQKLPRMGAVGRFELRRIAVGVAEVRIDTNLTPVALGSALAQTMADHLTLATTQSADDSLHLTLRVRTDAEASPTFEEESAEGQ
jgi:hypothetical protein